MAMELDNFDILVINAEEIFEVSGSKVGLNCSSLRR